MSIRRSLTVALALAASIIGPSIAAFADAADETAIRGQAAEFARLFNAGDAGKIAAMWSDGGVYIDEAGRPHTGRAAIEDTYKKLFARAGTQPIDVKIESIVFPSDTVAIETGTTALSKGNTCARYTAVHQKAGGQWQMINVTETGCAPAAQSTDSLNDLAWLAGNWTATGPKGTMPMHAGFDANHHFLYCTFGNLTAPDSTQIIGLDDASHRLTSWHYDANGGRGRSFWRRDGKDWLIRGVSVEPDGKRGQAAYLIHQVDSNNFTWRCIARALNGKRIAASTEVKVTRSN